MKGCLLVAIFFSSFKGTEGLCRDGFQHPENCSLTNTCKYEAYWTVTSDAVHFEVKTKLPDGIWSPDGFWTGIGYNTHPDMDGAHTVLLGIQNKGDYDNPPQQLAPKEFDLVGHGSPKEVESEKLLIYDSSIETVDDGLSLNFSRPLAPTAASAAFDLNSTCVFLLYPVSGGPVKNGKMKIHSSEPLVSPAQFCFATCKRDQSFTNEVS